MWPIVIEGDCAVTAGLQFQFIPLIVTLAPDWSVLREPTTDPASSRLCLDSSVNPEKGNENGEAERCPAQLRIQSTVVSLWVICPPSEETAFIAGLKSIDAASEVELGIVADIEFEGKPPCFDSDQITDANNVLSSRASRGGLRGRFLLRKPWRRCVWRRKNCLLFTARTFQTGELRILGT
jgi:hypothetical protein